MGQSVMLWFTTVALLCAAMPSAVNAELIHFRHEGRGSGTLNGVAFPLSDFVIKGTGDTGNRGSFANVFFVPHTSSTISIQGLGTFDFVTSLRTFVNTNGNVVGVTRSSSGGDLFNGPTDSQFATWEMVTSIGPVSGDGRIIQWGAPPVITSGGVLRFDENWDTPAVFTATIPSPASASVLALVFVTLTRKRRERTSSFLFRP